MNLHESFFKTHSFDEVLDALRRSFDDVPFEVKTIHIDETKVFRPRQEKVIVTVPRRARVEFTLNENISEWDKSKVIDVNVSFQSYSLVHKRCNYHHEFSWYLAPDTTVKAWNNFMTSCRSWHLVLGTTGREQWSDELKLWNHKSLDEITPRSFTDRLCWAKRAGLAEVSVKPFVPDSQPFIVEVQKNTLIAAGVIGIVSVNKDSFLTPANEKTINPWFLIQCQAVSGMRGTLVYDGKNSYYRATPHNSIHRLCVDSDVLFVGGDPLSASDKAFLDEVIGMWLKGQDRQLLEEKSA